MPDFLTVVYLVYSFIALYFLFLFVVIYAKNRKDFFYYPPLTKIYSLSVVIPCFNEQDDIGGTIESVLASDYKGLKKIIVVDDCSTDDSFEIIKGYAKEYAKVIAVQTPKNTGCAAGSKNYGSTFVDTELIAFVDADSYPEKDSITKIVGFFDNDNTAVVTGPVLAKNRRTFIEVLQAVEYRVIAFTRKLLGYIDSIYVTPGPLAVYRKKCFDAVGRFDEKNLTEDIEITWHLLNRGWGVEMSVPAHVYTVVPDNFKGWYKQRLRWSMGGTQTINKYKKSFFKKGMLGSFVLPFFTLSWVISFLGMGILVYRLTKRAIINYLVTAQSIGAQAALLRFNDINLTPNVLVFFGVAIFAIGFLFTILSLAYVKERDFKKVKLHYFLIYSSVYLLMYPIILVISMFKLLRRERSW